MLRFVNMDLVAALGALAWAIACLYLAKLETYCSGEVAFAFFLAAGARGIAQLRTALAPASE